MPLPLRWGLAQGADSFYVERVFSGEKGRSSSFLSREVVDVPDDLKLRRQELEIAHLSLLKSPLYGP